MKQTRALIIEKQRGALDYQQVRNTLAVWLGDISNGRYMLSLKRIVERRTDPQNRLMWLWFRAIAREWSEANGVTFTPQMVHDAYCLLYLPIDTPRGVVAGSTSKLNVEEFTEFLNNIQADAASSYGIQLPSPEDKLFEVWAEQYEGE